MLRDLEKQKGRAVRSPGMMRGTSWTPKQSVDGVPEEGEGAARHPHQSALRSKGEGSHQRSPKGVAFGTSVPEKTSSKKR